MQRLIITGANGVGKSHLARRLSNVRADYPVISYDTLRLTTDWQKRPQPEIDAALACEIARPAWILEGGPSMLHHALTRADGLIWIDPSEALRAWRLALRPWKYFGKTRAEIPCGNVDWPLQQYRFAWRSLQNRSKFRNYIGEVFDSAQDLQKWRCRTANDIESVVQRWISAEV